MVQPWEDPIAKATQGFLGGFQMARNAQMQNQQMAQKKQQAEFEDDVQTFNTLTQYYKDAQKGAGETYLTEIQGELNKLAEKIATRSGIKWPKWDGKFDRKDFKFIESFNTILNSSMPLDEAKRAVESNISDMVARGTPKTVVDQMKEQAAQSIYSDIKSSPDMGGGWRLKREGLLSAVAPSGLGKQLGQEQRGERLGLIGGTLNTLGETDQQRPFLEQAFLREGGKPSEMRDINKTEGIWSDSGYLSKNGEPVLRNSRSGKYKVGETEYGSIPKDAYTKAGLSVKEEEGLTGTAKTLKIFKDIEDTINTVSTGFPKAGEAKVAVNRYLSKEDAIKFNAARDQLRNLAQEVIKGIPSNFDVENFAKTLPSADYTLKDNMERIRQSKRLLQTGIRSKIQNAKIARKPIPQEVMEAVIEFNIFGKEPEKQKEIKVKTWEELKKQRGY